MTNAKPPVHVCECGKIGWINIGKAYVCVVDANVAPILGIWTWFAHLSNGNIYVERATWHSSPGKKPRKYVQSLHVLLCPTPKGMVVDHKNGNALDNRRQNLEPVTAVINAHRQRKKKTASSSYRGVSAFRGKWRVTLQNNKRYIHVGMFDDEVEAAKAYDEVVVKYYGDYAVRNFDVAGNEVTA